MPTASMDSARIAELLTPFLEPESLAPAPAAQLSTYLDLLLKWNARMNLTAVRDPEQIVTRHFGESVFAATHLFPDEDGAATLADVGSGAGFPGLPIALIRPQVRVTLLEAHNKKAVFLKECVRSTGASNVRVLVSRAEACVEQFDVVTLRAVEQFGAILPISATLVNPAGRLAALVGCSQVVEGEELLGREWLNEQTVNFPGSAQRTLWISRRRED